MNITWIILLLYLFKGNGCGMKSCGCDTECGCAKKMDNCDCPVKKQECCGSNDNQSSPFPVFNGSGMGNTSTCGCDS